MFGMSKKRMRVAITSFRSGGDASYGHSHLEDNLTKKEVLKQVSEWWDNHGTGFNDYDAIQLKLMLRKSTTRDAEDKEL